MDLNRTIKSTTTYTLPHREWHVLQHVAKNPSILTRDINTFATTMKPQKHVFKKGVSQPHVELAKKGLLYSTSRGGQAKYWRVTRIGRQIVDDKEIDLVQKGVGLYVVEDDALIVDTTNEYDFEGAFHLLCDLVLPKLTRTEFHDFTYKLPIEISKRILWSNLDEATKIAIEINGMEL